MVQFVIVMTWLVLPMQIGFFSYIEYIFLFSLFFIWKSCPQVVSKSWKNLQISNIVIFALHSYYLLATSFDHNSFNINLSKLLTEVNIDQVLITINYYFSIISYSLFLFIQHVITTYRSVINWVFSATTISLPLLAQSSFHILWKITMVQTILFFTDIKNIAFDIKVSTYNFTTTAKESLLANFRNSIHNPISTREIHHHNL